MKTTQKLITRLNDHQNQVSSQTTLQIWPSLLEAGLHNLDKYRFFFSKKKSLFFFQSFGQYHTCRCPGGNCRQEISKYDTDPTGRQDQPYTSTIFSQNIMQLKNGHKVIKIHIEISTIKLTIICNSLRYMLHAQVC